VKHITIIIIFIIISSSIYANDTTKVKKINIGVGLSTHSLINLKFEYLTHILRNKLSFETVFSAGKIKISNNQQKVLSFYVGANYYFIKPYKSLFIGIGIGYFKEEFLLSNYEEYYDENYQLKNADLFFSDNYFFYQIKLGYKFYIRDISITPEIGLFYRKNINLTDSYKIYENGNKEETSSGIEYKNILPNLSINFAYNF